MPDRNWDHPFDRIRDIGVWEWPELGQSHNIIKMIISILYANNFTEILDKSCPEGFIACIRTVILRNYNGTRSWKMKNQGACPKDDRNWDIYFIARALRGRLTFPFWKVALLPSLKKKTAWINWHLIDSNKPPECMETSNYLIESKHHAIVLILLIHSHTC